MLGGERGAGCWVRNYYRGSKSEPPRVSPDPVSLLRLLKVQVLDLFHSVFKVLAFWCSSKGFYSDPNGPEVTYGTPSSRCECVIWNPEVA